MYTEIEIESHPVVSQTDWLEARKDFLAKEKEFIRLRDELSRQRRALPWVRVEKEYIFDGPNGKETLADLFEGRSQLIIYHFMFGPDWEAGCPHCSFWADNFNSIIVHLNHRDVTMTAVSRAPLQKLEAFKKRMGWTFKWVSSAETGFNFDYHVSFSTEDLANKQVFYNYAVHDDVESSEREGASVFYRDPEGRVSHTYSTYARGIDMLNTAYHYLDLVSKGRDEDRLEFAQAWVRYHDRYEN